MLKWTARAFALAATLQLGIASAQETDVELIPPGPNEVESGAELEAPPLETQQDLETRDVPAEDLPPAEDALPNVDEAQEQAREDLENARDAQEEAIERESRFRPEAAPPAGGVVVDERVRAATANLDIDDETRARYRFHNGEWWFQTRSGGWKFYRDGRWHDFDPATYVAPNPGLIYDGGSVAPRPGYSGSFVAPPAFGSTRGYYYESRPYATTRFYGTYRPDYELYDGRYYRGGYGPRVYGGDYYGRGYGYGYGPGWQGYDPGSDRYYGYGSFGRPYSIDGDRYRGGVIGSEIGGRLGGRAGAILGGAIGADAAD